MFSIERTRSGDYVARQGCSVIPFDDVTLWGAWQALVRAGGAGALTVDSPDSPFCGAHYSYTCVLPRGHAGGFHCDRFGAKWNDVAVPCWECHTVGGGHTATCRSYRRHG